MVVYPNAILACRHHIESKGEILSLITELKFSIFDVCVILAELYREFVNTNEKRMT